MIQKLINVAKDEIGAKESNGGDDKYIKWYGGFALNVAWCAIFVSWCAMKAGITTSIIPKFADCDAGLKWFKARDKYSLSKAYGGEYTHKPGDIIFFSKVEKQIDSTHVGIVSAVGNSVVHTLEGNSADSVRTKSYMLNDKYIIGYGRPAYKTVAMPGEAERVSLKKLVGSLDKTPTLMQQDRAIVKAVQNVLIAKGFSCGTGGADGLFGPGTKKAVIAYQTKVVGLKKPDGVITSGNKTWKKLLGI